MHPSSYQPASKENAGYGKAITKLLIAAGVGLVASLIHVMMVQNSGQRFMYAYVIGFAFALSLALGCLFFILVNHLSNAGWSVLIRRVFESFALNIILLAVLFLPIAGSVALGNGWLYYWAQPDEKVLVHHYDPFGSHEAAGDAEHAPAITHETPEASHPPAAAAVSEETHGNEAAAVDTHAPAEAAHAAGEHAPELDKLILDKRGYLNRPFFIIRWIGYFAIWGFLGWYYWSRSVKQDTSGDYKITEKLHHVAGPAMFVYGITLTLAAFDLLMSIEAHWFSTIFGVYYFAGSMVCTFSFLTIFIHCLQKNDRITKQITKEHYHDLGKFMFGFVFFWSYIAFSQYMLTWYSNMPEETFWFHKRGVSTQVPAADVGTSVWSYVALLILFGHFALPFAGLLSRHVKRNMKLLLCWAVWLVLMHWVDMAWVVLPALDVHHITFGVAEIGLSVTVISIYLAGVLTVLGWNSPVPIKDPRLNESLAFQNM